MEDIIEPMTPRFKNNREVLQLILEHMDETDIESMKRVDILLQRKQYDSLSPREKRLVETFDEWHDMFGKQMLNKLFDRIMLMKELCGGTEKNKSQAPVKTVPNKQKAEEVPKNSGFQKASTLRKWGV